MTAEKKQLLRKMQKSFAALRICPSKGNNLEFFSRSLFPNQQQPRGWHRMALDGQHPKIVLCFTLRPGPICCIFEHCFRRRNDPQ
jgi:hypothetical protein